MNINFLILVIFVYCVCDGWGKSVFKEVILRILYGGTGEQNTLKGEQRYIYFKKKKLVEKEFNTENANLDF